jgi:hypothetical protein
MTARPVLVAMGLCTLGLVAALPAAASSPIPCVDGPNGIICVVNCAGVDIRVTLESQPMIEGGGDSGWVFRDEHNNFGYFVFEGMVEETLFAYTITGFSQQGQCEEGDDELCLPDPVLLAEHGGNAAGMDVITIAIANQVYGLLGASFPYCVSIVTEPDG